MDALARRFEQAPYAQGIGLRVEHADRERARLRVPFAEANSNPGGALHGGVGASLIELGGALAAWAGADGAPTTEGRTLDVAVVYLAAAIGEDVVADARVLRRGKEIVYVDVDVLNDAGKAIARGLVTYRVGPPGRPDHQRSTTGDPPQAPGDPPAFARFFTAAPFMARLGLDAQFARDGHSAVTLPWNAANAGIDGALDEGALAALMDTTAAMASWSLVKLDPRNKASTVGLHVSYFGRLEGQTVTAEARTLSRNDEIFANVVTVTAGGRAIAAGTVTYRIVVA